MKILWVEDELDQFESFSFAVREKNDVEVVNNFKDAKERIIDNEYDLYIVDIIIPIGEMDLTLDEIISSRKKYFGLEFIETLKNKNVEASIMVLTIVRDDKTLKKIKELDPNIDIFSKYEIDAEELALIIDKKIAK